MGTLNFYKYRLGRETFLCSANIDDVMGEPLVNDIVWLPFNAPDEDREMYVVKQRYIDNDEINYFCDMYTWDV